VTLPDASRGASDAREPLRRPLLLGLALVSVLLVVACANTGGLLLARLASRSGEFGVRIAIGAGRARLLRQLMVEALLLAVLATAAGLVVARVAAPVLLRSMPLASIPPDFEVRFDWRLVAFTTAIAVLAGLVAGSASLLRLIRTDPSTILTLNSRTLVRGRRRATAILIATQVACSLPLLVVAGAMTRSLINLGRVDPGFDAGGIVAIRVDATGRTPDTRLLPAYYAQLQERIASAPQVARVSFAQIGLMTSAATTGTIDIAGWSPASDEDRWVRMFFVGADFFETLGMPLLAGSSIGRVEATSRERVAVVNRALAEFYFGTVANAVGRTVNRDIRIVGVTADARYRTLRDEPVRAMFVPSAQTPPRTSMTFLVRTTGDISSATTAALAAVRAHDSALEAKAVTLRDQIAATLSRERFVAVLAGVLSSLALFLSCGGLFAAVAYAVSERHSELAVRLALGATARDIVLLVLTDPLRMTAIGLILGIPGAYATMRAVDALLFEVAPFDLATIAGSGIALMAVATVAAVLPARRAATIDPQECLKST
jgi:predicted permease